MRQKEDICHALTTAALTSPCQANFGLLCFGPSVHHLHIVEKRRCIFFLHMIALTWAPPLSFPSSRPGTASFTLLPSDPGGKSLPRWRLALAQEAMSGASPTSPQVLCSCRLQFVSRFRCLVFKARAILLYLVPDTPSPGPSLPKPIRTISVGFWNQLADSKSIFVIADFFIDSIFVVCSKLNDTQCGRRDDSSRQICIYIYIYLNSQEMFPTC